MWGRFASTRFPASLQRWANRAFARVVGVDLTESEHPPEAYPSLSAFFVRKLKPGLRSWPVPEGVPGSPVDGVLGAHGTFQDGHVLQAKGLEYALPDLLQEREHGRFESGVFFTIYLSPRHYHRIHAPAGGRLREARAVPGRLLPVNLPAVRSVPDLFPRNERLVALLERGGVELALVAVGAYNVGSVSAAFDPGWGGGSGGTVTNRAGRTTIDVRRYDPPLSIERGEELMAFHLGSTVVMVVSSPWSFLPPIHPGLREGAELRLGSPLFDGPLA